MQSWAAIKVQFLLKNELIELELSTDFAEKNFIEVRTSIQLYSSACLREIHWFIISQ